MRTKISIASTISCMLAATCIMLSAIILLTVKVESDEAALDSANVLFQEIVDKTTAKLDQFIRPVDQMTRVMAATLGPEADGTSDSGLYRNLNAFKAVLDANEQIMSTYLGYDNSHFYQLIAVRNNAYIINAYNAPEHCAYIDRIICCPPAQDPARTETWRYFDASLNLLATRSDTTTYDPRVRPWYGNALIAEASIFTAPYVFSSSRLPGITCAHKLDRGNGVLGMDVSIAGLSEILARQQVGGTGRVWIMDTSGRLIAVPGTKWEAAGGEMPNFLGAAEASDPAIRAVSGHLTRSEKSSGQTFFLDIGNKAYMASLTPVQAGTGLHLAIASAVPVSDITGYISKMMMRILLISFAALALLILGSLYAGRKLSRPVLALVREAEKIQKFDFSPSAPVTTSVAEIHSLGEACSIMKETIQSNTEHLIKTQDRLKKLVDGGLALTAEKDLSKLVSMIFESAMNLSGADGGVMYLMDGEKLSVEFVAHGNRVIPLGILSDTDAPRVMVSPALTQFLTRDSVLYHACEAFNSRTMMIRQEKALSLFPTDTDCFPKDYGIDSVISAPVVTRGDKILGVVQLFNPRQINTQDSEDKNTITDLLASIVSQAAVGLDNRNLVNSLEELFNALIKVIAASIDAKSPYTGGHCTRVPKLAEMLAGKVSESRRERLKAFTLSTKEEWRQLHIAAWLHDCGKVTTPEYVVDKATKLETIYDRIHEVRMRFEVLLRDAQIDYYQKCLEGGRDPETLKEEMEEEIRKLQEEFDFIAQCNIGGEFMSEDKKERIRQIAKREWTRHFSDEAGIGPLALEQRKTGTPPELPVQEPLLKDSPDLRIPREKSYEHIKDIYGNPILVPENEYDRGEIYNLCIDRGTLTAEERFKINEHMLAGIEMLSQIPFPEDLARVPDIATGHHETLTGTGYPLKKSLDHLSVESRILAIADIFEALTASDRPYKKAKTVSQALKIMTFMRKDKHIDPDIFDIFLEHGVYREYAKDCLAPEQMDIDDISKFLSQTETREEKDHGND